MNSLIKKTVLASVIAASVVSLNACGDKKFVFNQNGELIAPSSSTISKDSSFNDKASYAIGASLGAYVLQMQQSQDLSSVLNNEIIVQAFSDGLKGFTKLDKSEIENALKDLDKQVQEKLEKEAKAEAEDNKKQGEAFLAANATAQGVVTTKSGLQYRVVTEGNGEKPQKGDIIKVTYTGKTIDGNIFDEQKKPVEFPLDNMIPGWVEGLQLMSPGAEYDLFIPANLAYGEQPVGKLIKPNSTLVFNVKLVEVKKPAPKAEEKAEADK